MHFRSGAATACWPTHHIFRMNAVLWAVGFARLIGQCLLCLLTLMGSAWAADASNQVSDEQVYEQAQLHMRKGETKEAIRNLSILVERSPLHLGALLDLAIVYCQSNKQQEAQTRFDKLAQFSDLPPAIEELISYYRENCRVPASAWRSFASTGIGRTHNLNQGPRDEYFYLAPLNLTLQLAEGTRPRNDGFKVLEAGISRSSSPIGWYGGAFIQQVDYDVSNDYDNLLGDAKVGYRFKKDTFNVDVMGNISHLSMGQKSYLTSTAASISAMRPVSHDGSWEAGGAVTLTDRNYLTTPDYRARVVDVRALLQWRPTADLRLLGELGQIKDTAMGNRPGGNSGGEIFQLTSQWQLTPRQLVELFHRQTWLSDQSAYSTAFFGDVKRHPHTASWNAAWRYQLRKDLHLRLSARYGSNHDTLSFFNYQTSTHGIALEWWPK